MQEQVFLTFFIPVYNAEKFISSTLENFKSQTLQNFEVIFADDCSTDNSYSLIENFIKENSGKGAKYKLYKPEKNLGAGHYHLPYLPDMISGEYFFALTHDDKIDDDYVEKCFKKSQEGDFDIILTDLALKDNNKKTYLGQEYIRQFINGELTSEDLFLKSLNWEISVAGPRRVKLLKECGYFSSEFYNIDEYAFRLSFLKTNKIGYTNTTYYYTVGNQNALSVSAKPFTFDVITTDIMLFEKLIENKFDNAVINIKAQELFEKIYKKHKIFCKNINSLNSFDKEYIINVFKNAEKKSEKLYGYFDNISRKHLLKIKIRMKINYLKYTIKANLKRLFK